MLGSLARKPEGARGRARLAQERLGRQQAADARVLGRLGAQEAQSHAQAPPVQRLQRARQEHGLRARAFVEPRRRRRAQGGLSTGRVARHALGRAHSERAHARPCCAGAIWLRARRAGTKGEEKELHKMSAPWGRPEQGARLLEQRIHGRVEAGAARAVLLQALQEGVPRGHLRVCVPVIHLARRADRW